MRKLIGFPPRNCRATTAQIRGRTENLIVFAPLKRQKLCKRGSLSRRQAGSHQPPAAVTDNNYQPSHLLTIVHIIPESAKVEGQPSHGKHGQDDNEGGSHQDNGEGLEAALLRGRGHGRGRQIARIPPQAPSSVVLGSPSSAVDTVIRRVRVLAHVSVRGSERGPPANGVSSAAAAASVRRVIRALERVARERQTGTVINSLIYNSGC